MKRLMRDAASADIPRIHSWKVMACPRVLLEKISGHLAMVEILGDFSTVEQHEDVIEKCRHARKLIKYIWAMIFFLRASFCNLVKHLLYLLLLTCAQGSCLCLT